MKLTAIVVALLVVLMAFAVVGSVEAAIEGEPIGPEPGPKPIKPLPEPIEPAEGSSWLTADKDPAVYFSGEPVIIEWHITGEVKVTALIRIEIKDSAGEHVAWNPPNCGLEVPCWIWDQTNDDGELVEVGKYSFHLTTTSPATTPAEIQIAGGPPVTPPGCEHGNAAAHNPHC